GANTKIFLPYFCLSAEGFGEEPDIEMKGNFLWFAARGHERVPRRITTSVERTEKYKATTHSARAKINRFAIVSQSRFEQRLVFLHHGTQEKPHTRVCEVFLL
ncbi:hypothetical protein COU16_00640, partial [Candidatus Kaiserbacteria bacterium CG10_big_fil_rev_8_21_14_0_10_47_16]